MLILFFASDLPDGNYAALKKKGGMSKDNGMKVFLNAIRNYRCVPPHAQLHLLQSRNIMSCAQDDHCRGACLLTTASRIAADP